MSSTAIVVAVVIGLVVVILLLRARGKSAAAAAEPRFQPPREIAPRPSKDAAPAPAAKEPPAPVEAKAPEKTEPPIDPTPLSSKTPIPSSGAAEPKPVVDEEATPASSEELAADAIEAEEEIPAVTKAPPTTVPPPAPPVRATRPPLPSYSDISDAPEGKLPPPRLPPSDGKLPRVSEAKVPAARPPVPPAPKAAPSEPKKLPVSEPKVAAAPPKVAEPKLPVSEPKIPAAKPSEPKAEHDFSALNEPPKAEPKEAPKPTGLAARFAIPSNPETADLEKNDPRHAAARRLARVSVSEIKLYHEAEVKAGREANDLWKRLITDIGLATQTFEQRTPADVRERFDYLYDEILRQLAEGDVAKLGPDAPKKKAAAAAAPAPAPEAETKPALPADEPSAVPTPLPTAETPPAAETAPPVAEEPKPEPAKAEEPAKPAEAPKPTGLAARLAPSNPETAELEKGDPRHAAARRLARLSVSEIKLYHEDEVKAGREAKDLYKRLSVDIGLAIQTYEKRVDKEVRERFDYLYDELLRQLAEGDVAKLGPEAPAPKKPVIAAPAPAPEPVKAPEPTPAPVEAAAPAEAPAPAPAPVAEPPKPAGLAARFAPPSNPETAELEKSDPRHAAARRLARLSVSEIKLYHEDDVKAGREAKDLWKRLITDIGLATQTYEKRVDKEVRERFDYLYDEILRQLAEGDAAKLGPEAPQKAKANA